MALRQQRVDIDASAFLVGLRSSVEDIVRRGEQAVDSAGQIMARQSQSLVPVEFGDLKDSMATKSGRTRTTTSKKTGIVRGNNYFFEVRYSDKAAWFQELGTIEHTATPFLRPARQSAAQRLRAL